MTTAAPPASETVKVWEQPTAGEMVTIIGGN